MDRKAAKCGLRELKNTMLNNTQKLIENRHIHGEPVEFSLNGELHRALHYQSAYKKAPVYFDIHGGGFTWGMMEEGDLFCHQINEQMGFEVYSLDYPLMPECEYPDALHWLYDSVSYVWQHAGELNVDPEQMLIGGRSAGGNLAAALCLLSIERGEFQFVCQVLDHPYLDLNGVIPEDERYTGDNALPVSLLNVFATAYATQEQRQEATCTPLCAGKDLLRQLPPAVIQTCELDSLRVDGERYADLLKDAGVFVSYHCYPQVTHGFTEVEGTEERKGQQWLIDEMKRVLNHHQYQ